MMSRKVGVSEFLLLIDRSNKHFLSRQPNFIDLLLIECSGKCLTCLSTILLKASSHRIHKDTAEVNLAARNMHAWHIRQHLWVASVHSHDWVESKLLQVSDKKATAQTSCGRFHLISGQSPAKVATKAMVLTRFAIRFSTLSLSFCLQVSHV